MDKNDVSSVLRALAAGDSSRSETARLRDVYDDVEAALAAGVSRAAILEKLKDNGFTMTLKSFESALYRIRKKRDQGAPAGRKPEPARASRQVTPTAPEPDPVSSVSESNETTETTPATLDAIMSSTPDLEALANAHRRKKGTKE